MMCEKEFYLQHTSKESHVCIDIYDDAGIGGGASGVSGGLLHPYSPKGFSISPTIMKKEKKNA